MVVWLGCGNDCDSACAYVFWVVECEKSSDRVCGAGVDSCFYSVTHLVCCASSSSCPCLHDTDSSTALHHNGDGGCHCARENQTFAAVSPEEGNHLRFHLASSGGTWTLLHRHRVLPTA